MNEVKILEVRDRGTFIPVMAIKVRSSTDGQEDWLLRKSGWGQSQSGYYMFSLTGDFYRWAISLGDPRFLHTSNLDIHDRTHSVAFKYIASHWDDIEPGQVIDVRVILGEEEMPVDSERHYES